MSILKYLVPALAVAKSALAQQGACSGTTTLSSNADASGLAACITWDGDIAIATQVAETINLPPTLFEITGDLVADGASNMTGLSGGVRTIGGTFRLREVQAVTTLSFQQLTDVDTIDWVTIPILSGLDFGTPGVTRINSLSISDTALQNLDGISPTMANNVLITQNGELQRVEMQLTNVTGNMTFSANGNNMLDLRLPNLEGSDTLIVSECGSVSIPSLQYVNGSAAFISNGFEGLSAPNLTDVGSLRITRNENLNNVSFPALQQCAPGDLNIQNNPQLTGTISFPQLTRVLGAIRLTGGAWQDFSIPKIELVRGQTSLASTQDISAVCSRYKAINGRDLALKGTYSCRGGADETGAGGNQGGAGGGNNSAASSLYNSASVGLLGALGITLALFGQL